MKLNILKLSQLVRPRTHEGAVAATLTPEQALRRSVMACMLWESEFYEDGVAIAGRIRELVPRVTPAKVAAMALEARTAMKLRHVPLLLVREMARHATHRALVAETLAQVIQRADELAEFVAIYWADGRAPLSGQVKKGLAAAFPKFDEYALAKYDRAGAVKLRDVLFLCHAKPLNAEQAALWKRLIAGELATPDTWEVALSSGEGDKRSHWERLLAENKLGALALLRNLRNMQQAGVEDAAIRGALRAMKTERVLPFRFITAARHAPMLEPALEEAMFRCLEGQPVLKGRTVLCVDNSGSMHPRHFGRGAMISAKSELARIDAACALAMLLREVCEDCQIVVFADSARAIRPRRGFALRDEILKEPVGGTDIGNAVAVANGMGYDRVIVLTDEQTAARGVFNRTGARDPLPGTKGYFVNVASAKNGVGYGAWSHIDGWSEAIVEYIRAAEHAAA